MVGDASETVSPAGAPATEKVTAVFNNAPTVAVMVVCTLWPSFTVSDAGAALSEILLAAAEASVQ